MSHWRAPLDESDYWPRLEYRVCDELDGLRHTVARPYWCDGFVATRYVLDGHSPRILGRVWMGIGRRDMVEWEFTLLLGRCFGSVDEIAWADLLPPPDVTKWLTVDPRRKHVTIEPLSAVPDG